MMRKGKVGAVKWGSGSGRSRGMCLGGWERTQEVRRVEKVVVRLAIAVVVVAGGAG